MKCRFCGADFTVWRSGARVARGERNPRPRGLIVRLKDLIK